MSTIDTLELLHTLRVLTKARKYSEVQETVERVDPFVIGREPEIGFHLAVSHLHQRRNHEGLDLTNQLLPIAFEAGDLKLANRLQLIRSAFLSREGLLSEAEIAVQMSMKESSWDAPLRFTADANNTLGVLQSMRGDWDSARAQLNRALTQFTQLGDRWGVATANHNLGVSSRYRGDNPRAEEHFSAAAEFYSADGTDFERAFSESERSLALAGLGLTRLAETMARRGLSKSESLNSAELIGEGSRALGIVLRAGNKTEEARSCLLRSIEMSKKCFSRQLRAESHEELAMLYCSRGDLDLAREHLLKARRHYRTVGAWGFDRRLSDRIDKTCPQLIES